MNYIFNVIYIIFIFALYNFYGSQIVKCFSKKKKTFSLRIITGYLFVYFIGFIIGYPSQLFSISWFTFSIVYTIVLILCVIFFISIYDLKLENFHFKFSKEALKDHLIKYWFIYALAVIFSILSITNLQPYYMNNYHDDYYISKVVSLVGSKHLLNRDYMLGSVLKNTGYFSFAKAQGYRMFNTYELIYSYWGSLFQMDLSFFCRFSMVIHNYFLVFLTYQLVATLFLKEEVAQYALMFFTLLMIPSGYASRGMSKFSIRMFENWRFQTAIFYGGSVTRVMELPLIVFFLNSMLKKLTLKKIIAFIAFVLTMLSFQTNAIGYVILSLPFMILSYVVYQTHKRYQGQKALQLTILFLSLAVMFIVLIDKLLPYLPFNLSTAEINAKRYQLYYINVFSKDFFALTGLACILAVMFLNKSLRCRMVCLFVLLLFLMFRFDQSNIFLNLLSYFFYGTARILTSVLLLCVLFSGLMIMGILHKLHWKQFLSVVLATCSIISVPTYISKRMDQIVRYHEVEDGMTKFGYSLKPLLSNDKMVPNMFVEVGNYFNKMKPGPYKILTEKNMPYDHTTVIAETLLLVSRNIELCYDDAWYKNSDYDKIDDYLTGKTTIDKVALLIQYSKSGYILTTRENIKIDLCKYGYKAVLGNKKKGYWLLKGHF